MIVHFAVQGWLRVASGAGRLDVNKRKVSSLYHRLLEAANRHPERGCLTQKAGKQAQLMS
jgi:hypothetical protein